MHALCGFISPKSLARNGGLRLDLRALIVLISVNRDSVGASNILPARKRLLLSYVRNEVRTCGPLESQLEFPPSHSYVSPHSGVEVQPSTRPCFRPP